MSVFIRGTIVPLATPEEVRGRVLAVEYVFIAGSNELGGFRVGREPRALLGVAGAVVFGGAGTLAVVAIWLLWFPELRSIDRFAEVQPDT